MSDRMKLTRLRWERTHAATVVKRQIAHLVDTPAKWDMQGRVVEGTPEAMTCLQSWWPFWSDVLKERVRDAVRAARALDIAEREGVGPLQW